MRKRIIILYLIAVLVSSVALIGHARDGYFDQSAVFEGDNDIEKLHTTAYCLHGVTATGGTTRPNIAACNTHVGDVAIIYTLDGEYLGMYEITDTGGTEGLRAGKVIDVWFDALDECKEWMSITGGKCYVKWIKGVG